jgi:hypothetical protein
LVQIFSKDYRQALRTEKCIGILLLLWKHDHGRRLSKVK